MSATELTFRHSCLGTFGVSKVRLSPFEAIRTFSLGIARCRHPRSLPRCAAGSAPTPLYRPHVLSPFVWKPLVREQRFGGGALSWLPPCFSFSRLSPSICCADKPGSLKQRDAQPASRLDFSLSCSHGGNQAHDDVIPPAFPCPDAFPESSVPRLRACIPWRIQFSVLSERRRRALQMALMSASIIERKRRLVPGPACAPPEPPGLQMALLCSTETLLE
jgi:hypothetical protein